MNRKNESILHYLGVILLIGGFIYIIPELTSLVFNEPMRNYINYLAPQLFLFLLGSILIYFFREEELYDVKSGMVIAASAWLILPTIMGFTFYIGNYLSLEDSIFESMSGFTATGLTMFSNLSNQPRSILIFRSIVQWVGGVGVIVLFLSILSRSGDSAAMLYSAEGRTDKIMPNIIQTVRRIWGIYILYTFLCIIFLTVSGVRIFDAINVSMTTLATGGFATSDDSIASYGMASRIIIMLFMMMGAISFVNHYKLFHGKIRDFFNEEVNLMIIIILIFSLLLTLRHNASDSFFQTISAITGTGFSTINIKSWDDYSKFMMVILMIFGGSYGSTSSAIKMLRLLIILSAVIWVVRRSILPKGSVITPKVLSHKVETSTFVRTLSYFAVYLISLIVGALLFMSHGYSSADSLFEVASAEGNVGLSVGITTPLLPLWLKIVLIVEMWIGRLEIFPVVILLYYIIERGQDLVERQ